MCFNFQIVILCVWSFCFPVGKKTKNTGAEGSFYQLKILSYNFD